jgi:hypothetical protein
MVYHIAHEQGTNQQNFGGRSDYHNPEFNPMRLKENMTLNKSPTPEDEDA